MFLQNQCFIPHFLQFVFWTACFPRHVCVIESVREREQNIFRTRGHVSPGLKCESFCADKSIHWVSTYYPLIPSIIHPSTPDFQAHHPLHTRFPAPCNRLSIIPPPFLHQIKLSYLSKPDFCRCAGGGRFAADANDCPLFPPPPPPWTAGK